MKPTVGRVVLLHTIPGHTHAALIVFVHNPTMVNLAAFDENGVSYNVKSVTLVQRAETPPEFSMWCEWPMPVELPRPVTELPVVHAPPPPATPKAPPNAPRVTQTDVTDNIVDTEIVKHVSKSGQVLRWAVLTTRNGFAVVGKPSCAVCSENDDATVGEMVALENAKTELWPLMGYALRSKLFLPAERQVTDEMVDRFLQWPVPANVYPDGTPGQPGRTGTNLLDAASARQMLERVLS